MATVVDDITREIIEPTRGAGDGEGVPEMNTTNEGNGGQRERESERKQPKQISTRDCKTRVKGGGKKVWEREKAKELKPLKVVIGRYGVSHHREF